MWQRLKLFLCVKCGDCREIEDIPPRELDVLLVRFFVSAKTSDYLEYEPTTLKGFQGSVQRYLNEKHLAYNIITDKQFKVPQDTLKTKQKLLKMTVFFVKHCVFRYKMGCVRKGTKNGFHISCTVSTLVQLSAALEHCAHSCII